LGKFIFIHFVVVFVGKPGTLNPSQKVLLKRNLGLWHVEVKKTLIFGFSPKLPATEDGF